MQEFKVETATFDAQQGHTAGATVNVTLKSGTNRFQGDGYYHYRDEALSANDFFLERAGRPKDDTGYKRYGFTVGGPMVLGKLYDGRNKTFFFTAFEWLYDTFPEPGQFTVPTAAQRNGDFSALLSQGIFIYDPTTAVRRADGRIERQPFPGNIIPSNRISQIGRNYMGYYPMPNQAGDAQGRNNYISTNSRGDDFYSMNYRVDHVLTNKQRFFVRYSRNNRVENRGNWTGELEGIKPTGNFLFRINDALNVDHVWTMSNTSLLNVRASWSRFQEPSIRQNQGIFDPASLGFTPAATQYFGSNLYLPRFEMEETVSFSDLGDSFSGGINTNIYSVQPTWTLFRGKHSFRSGVDFRVYREDSFPSVHSAGRYDFTRNAVLTRQLDNSPAAATGQDLAAMLLGIPERRDHRSQRRSVQPGDLWRRFLPGRLEGDVEPDGQSRPALGVRGRADRALQSQRARLRSRRGVDHHKRSARPPMRPIRFRNPSVSVPRPRWPDVCQRHRTQLDVVGHQQLPATRRLRVSAEFEDRRAWRLGDLRGARALRHQRHLPARVLAGDQHGPVARRRPHDSCNAGQSVP